MVRHQLQSRTPRGRQREDTSSSDPLAGLGIPPAATAHWSSIGALAGRRDRSQEVVARVTRVFGKMFGVPEQMLPHMMDQIKFDLDHMQLPPVPSTPPSKQYQAFVNGRPVFKDAEGVGRLREMALQSKFRIFADDAHGQLVLCGCPENPEKQRIRKGETQTWKALLALLERRGSFWSYRELFEKVEDRPWKEVRDSRTAYQWVRHLREHIEDALEAWGVDRHQRFSVDEVFDTCSSPGRVCVSDRVTMCVVRLWREC